MRKTITLILALALAALPLAGCAQTPAPDPADGAQEKPIVAVTIVPEATFVQAVCGDLVEVVTMVPPGASPETYEPSPEQMEGLDRAALYFVVGVPVEDAYILSSVGENTKVVSLDEAVAAVYEPRVFEGGEPDPHIWLSPKRVKVMIEAISKEMCALDPDNAQIYEDNAKAYSEQFDELDEYIRGALGDAPGKAFIAYHPAFGYFADDYGLTMYALEEEGKEATPQHMQEVIDIAKEKGVKVIFYQAEMDSRQSAQFAEEIGGASVMLSPLSADYIDNLIAMADALAGALK
jgi:zinc transport system substrate-binding protein